MNKSRYYLLAASAFMLLFAWGSYAIGPLKTMVASGLALGIIAVAQGFSGRNDGE